MRYNFVTTFKTSYPIIKLRISDYGFSTFRKFTIHHLQSIN